jgi:putative two-component system response regulator
MDKRKKVLVVDDSENHSILYTILSDDYDIIEAKCAKKALSALMKRKGRDISLIFLKDGLKDVDGLECLKLLRQKEWVKKIPIIMISGELLPERMEKAYELGAVDYMCTPLDAKRVRHHAMLYVEIAESEKALERVGGEHVFHIQKITKNILDRLKERGVIDISEQEEVWICQAASLHDIGKLAIPQEILNKPGKLTKEEFEVIKTHPEEGFKILSDYPKVISDEPLYQIACQISLWHHERYDGQGYPDGLKGDEIPFAAQVVALADVYEALCSKRVYKDAYPKETAIRMIKNGECGEFNPVLLNCLGE